MQSLAAALCAFHDRITKGGAVLGALLLAVIVFLISTEVTLRYLFERPTTWTGDVVPYLQCGLIFLSLPFLTRNGGNVAIDILEQTVPALRVPLRMGIHLLGAVACGIALYMSGSETLRQFMTDVQTMGVHPIPKAAVSWVIAYGFGSTMLYFIRFLVTEFGEARDGQPAQQSTLQ